MKGKELREAQEEIKSYGYVPLTSQSPARGTRASDLSKQDVKEINEIRGYPFKNPELLKAAFVHSSLSDNTTFERLEFMGDRVIAGLVASNLDCDSFLSEGEMHRYFTPKTKNTYFAERYEALRLSRFLRFNPGSSKEKVYADAFEALIGAISLD